MGIQGTNIEATKKVKYLVKRNLSGAVVFTNMTNVGILSTTQTVTPVSITGTTTHGFNLVKWPNVDLTIWFATPPIIVKVFGMINNVAKTTYTLTPTAWTTPPQTFIYTALPLATNTIAASGSPTIKLKVTYTGAGSVVSFGVAFTKSVQRNDLTTVMI